MSLKITTVCEIPVSGIFTFHEFLQKETLYDTFLSKAEESKEDGKFKDAKVMLADNHFLPSESEDVASYRFAC